jgi:Tfp pilus assembly protein PilV
MQHMLLRPAIAMIELIFAIVVMGIAMLSVPLMIDTASKSNAIAFEQESIAIIASHANAMMTYAWDEQNTQTSTTPNSILNVTNGDAKLDGNTTVANQKRSKADANATTSTFFGAKVDPEITGSLIHPESIFDDVDDFHNVDTNLTIAKAGNQISTKGDFLDIGIKMHTNVIYLDDTAANYDNCSSNNGCAFSKDSTQWTAASGTTNIKLITTTLTSTNVSDKNIVLRSFMCNIGAAQPNTGTGLY